MHTMASDGETVLASDDETVLAAEHGEYSLEGRRVWVKSLSLGERAETRDIRPRIKVRNVETQVVPREFTRSIIENDMLNLWQSMEPLNASELLIELRGRAGDCGYDRAKDARHLMWQLKAEDEKDREATREPKATDTDLKADEDKAERAIPLPRPPKTQPKRAFALAPKIYPPPPPPKITTEEGQDTGGGDDEYAEDVDKEGAGDPLKPQGNRKRKDRDDDQLSKKKRKRKKKPQPE